MSKEKEIVPVEVEERTISPIVSPENAKAAMQAYQELCSAVLISWDRRKTENGVIVQESDYQRIPVRRREGSRWITEYKDFPKKSAWRKLGKFYKISDEIIGEPKRVDREDGSFVYHYTVKAIAPDGQYTFGVGSCDSKEIPDERRREHDTESKAHTRAKNRAISDLIGFGQVSAEEMTGEPKHVESQQTEVKPVEEKPRAKVGPPPRRIPPKPAAEEPQPEKKIQLSLGRINKNVIAYNLEVLGYVVDEDVSIVEEDDGFYVEPSKGLTDAEFNRINETLVPMGADWQADKQYWVFWKEAENRGV